MGRRPATCLVILMLAWAGLARAAWTEESGLWEADYRDSSFQLLSQSFNDIFKGKPKLYWARGPVFETEKKAFALHIGYEGQFDATWYGGMERRVELAAEDKWISGVDVRRSRVGFEAFFLRDFFIRVRYGWTGFDAPEFQDAFVEWSGITHLKGDWWPVIRVGQVKEAMTIDWMNNALRTTFAERAMFVTTIVPNRNPGVRMHGTAWDRRLTYQAGGYLVGAESLSNRGQGRGESATVRITGLPWAPDEDDRRLLHLGISASWRWDLDSTQLASQAESNLGPNVIDTGVFPSSTARVVCGELFLKLDRLSFTAEAAWRNMPLQLGKSANFWGAYATVSYFLTQNNQRYSRGLGCFGRIRPRCRLFCPAHSGLGDVEVAGRFSCLDLSDSPFPGGSAWTVTLGVNWYARDNIRLLLNYVYANVSDAYGVPGADGTMNTLVLRLAYDL